jgi:hypothetical protein
MNRRLLNAVGTFLFVCALAWPAAARADPMWSYSWSPQSSTIDATTGPGSIHLASESLVQASGGTNVLATSLTTSASGPSTFSSAAYSLTMTLTDAASGKSGTLTFSGAFDGTLSPTSAKISNTFTGLQTQQLILGSNQYTVTIGPYLPPGPPGATLPGGIGASVSVANLGNGGVDGGKAPEPSSLLLAGLGGAALMALRFRRRRTNPVPA